MNKIRKEDVEQIVAAMPYEECEGKVFLITGATGFLGSYMVDTLMMLKKNKKIIKCVIHLLCRNKEKAEKKFSEWISDEDFNLITQSVEDKIHIKGNIDFIIHAASCSQTRMFSDRPVDLLSANVIGTYNLLQLAKEKNTKSFLFFSSGSVYGESSDNILFEERTYNINYLNMRNSYASGKRMGEMLCKAFWKQYAVPTKCVRISHTYGPGIDIDDGHVYSDFAKSIFNNSNLIIKGDGTDSRPFCYVTDAIRAFWILLFDGVDGEVYNMANTKETLSIRELADILAYHVFADRNLEVIQNRNLVKDKEKRFVNIDKLRKLGWNPAVSIEEGFKRLIASLEEDNEMEKQRT